MRGYFGYEHVLTSMFENLRAQMLARPLNLGGVAGSGGGTGGGTGYVGQLPQSRVTYDTTEAAYSGLPTTSGYTYSLLDNLAHIRYRLDNLESSGVVGTGAISVYDDGVLVSDDITVLDFINCTVSLASPGRVSVTPSGSVTTVSGEITWDSIVGKPATYPPSSHTHDDRYYTESEVDTLLDNLPAASGVTWSGITGKPSVFPPETHTHDDRYYTESEVNALIASVSGTSVTASGGSLNIYSGGVLVGENITVLDFLSGEISLVEPGRVSILISGVAGSTGGTSFSGVYNEVVTGTTHFDTARTFLTGSLRVYYNGIRQATDTYTIDADRRGFTTSFTVASGELLTVDYNIATIGGSTIVGSGGGDMYKVIYDTNDDGVVDNSEALQGHDSSYFATADHTHTDLGDMLKVVYDSDNDGVVDSAKTLEGHPLSDFALLPLTPDHYHADNELPTGLINNVNKEFVTENIFVAGSTRLYLNGLRQIITRDYAEGVNLDRVIFEESPLTGDVVSIDYIYTTQTVTSGEQPTFSGALFGPYTTLVGTESITALPGHCHTTESDGTLTPTELATAYHDVGVEAILITDHNKVTVVPSGIATLDLGGDEISSSLGHMAALVIDSEPSSSTAQTCVTEINDQGGLPVCAHPNWITNWTDAEVESLAGWLGIEIFNMYVQTGAGSNPNTYPGFAVENWDRILSSYRRDLWGTAGDDIHTPNYQRRVGVGLNKLFVSSLTKENIQNALKYGNFVADVSNSGVTPGIPNITNSQVSLTCAGASSLRFIGDTGLLATISGETGTYNFAGTEKYVRIEAVGDYTESFDSALGDDWSSYAGTWIVSSGILRQTATSTGPYLIYLRRFIEGDWDVQMDIRFPNTVESSAMVGILINSYAANYGWLLNVGQVGSGGSSDGNLELYPRGNSTAVAAIDTALFSANQNTWYTMKLSYNYLTNTCKGKMWETGTSEPDWMVEGVDTVYGKRGMFAIRGRRAFDIDNLYINGYKTYYQPIPVGDWE